MNKLHVWVALSVLGLGAAAFVVSDRRVAAASGDPLFGIVEYGKLQFGEEKVLMLRHKNETDDIWIVQSVRPDCGCVSVVSYDAEVPPGGVLSAQVLVSNASDPRRGGLLDGAMASNKINAVVLKSGRQSLMGWTLNGELAEWPRIETATSAVFVDNAGRFEASAHLVLPAGLDNGDREAVSLEVERSHYSGLFDCAVSFTLNEVCFTGALQEGLDLGEGTVVLSVKLGKGHTLLPFNVLVSRRDALFVSPPVMLLSRPDLEAQFVAAFTYEGTGEANALVVRAEPAIAGLSVHLDHSRRRIVVSGASEALPSHFSVIVSAPAVGIERRLPVLVAD